MTKFVRVIEAAWAALARPEVRARMLWMVPLFFGLLSLRLGQDANWDLLNYHRYNPYALLNGKIGYDLAPGQWQGYFNPAIDLLYHGLNSVLPAPATGFAMGVLHGLNFILVLAIARLVLPQGAVRLPLMLALAGSLAPGFLAELGNTMGDNLTALFMLSALWLLLSRWESPPVARLLAAGLVAGVGTGLKLTNAIYALPMCLALLTLTQPFWLRVRAAFLFGCAVLAGMAASAGFWWWKMWQVFGNPMFPQFNHIFQGALAEPIRIGDTGWIPKGWSEKLLWPFIFTLDPRRVIEIKLTPLIWPIVYALFLALLVRQLRMALAARGTVTPMRGEPRFILLFFALAYLLWMNMFGIYRYLVPLELLAPLVLWLLLHQLMPAAPARRVGAALVGLALVAIFPFAKWDRVKWTREPFRAVVPHIAQPRQSMVFTVHGDPPMSWMVPFFPAELAFVSLGRGFPESDAYVERMREMVRQRSGPLYVMVQDAGASQPKVLQAAQAVLANYGMQAVAASCRSYDAFIGRDRRPYQMCIVARSSVP